MFWQVKFLLAADAKLMRLVTKDDSESHPDLLLRDILCEEALSILDWLDELRGMRRRGCCSSTMWMLMQSLLVVSLNSGHTLVSE